LNGAGRRTKYFFKVYVAALYVEEPAVAANKVIADPGIKRRQLTLLEI
jgi:Chalcone isomerase-like